MLLLLIAIILTGLLLCVVYFDLTSFIIPNWVNFAILGLYPIFLLATPQAIEWWYSLVVFAAFFAVGFLIFNFNIMGGGDVKMLIAVSIWIGYVPETLLKFGFLTAIAGGVLALIILAARMLFKMPAYKPEKEDDLPRILRMKAPIPYGLAISFAFGYLIWKNQILGLIVV